MAKKTQDIPMAGITIDAEVSVPLYRQLYNGVRDAILDGRLRPGRRLPATRVLARQMGISRNTVLTAFDSLLAEGYLESATGSGTYVSHSLPDDLLHVKSSAGSTADRSHRSADISRRGHSLTSTWVSTEGIIPFRHGVPDLREFPFHIWSKLIARQFRSLPYTEHGYGDPAGYGPLRQAVADYLRAARAVHCEPEQVIIVNGSQQGLDLSARLLLDEGSPVWIEEPGYLGARRAFAAAGAKLVPVPIDYDGMEISKGLRARPDARLAYVTPSHQFPIGVTMTLSRRLELLQWAADNNAWILEDDYDSEYRYVGNPLASLQGLDTGSRVIYMGTMSKVLFPALRIGYLVVPTALIDAFTSAKAVLDRNSAILEQAALTAFISEGHFGRHIRRMRMLYRERQAILTEAINAASNAGMRMVSTECGMHGIAWLTDRTDDLPLLDRAQSAGLFINVVSQYCLTRRRRPGLILGYAAFNERELHQGVKALVRMLRRTSA